MSSFFMYKNIYIILYKKHKNIYNIINLIDMFHVKHL